jgi:hypothetical protein
MQNCVKSGPDIVDKVESDMGSLQHILKADIIPPRTHHRLRLLLTEDLPELIRETRELRGYIGQRYVEEVDYEYALQMDSSMDEREPFTLAQYFPDRYATGEYWGEKEERQRNLDWLIETFPNSTFWMVKRRKAGKVERA